MAFEQCLSLRDWCLQRRCLPLLARLISITPYPRCSLPVATTGTLVLVWLLSAMMSGSQTLRRQMLLQVPSCSITIVTTLNVGWERRPCSLMVMVVLGVTVQIRPTGLGCWLLRMASCAFRMQLWLLTSQILLASTLAGTARLTPVCTCSTLLLMAFLLIGSL